MVLGHWVEMRSISQAQGALNELAKLLPDTAMRFVGERTEEVPASELRDGRPGTGSPRREHSRGRRRAGGHERRQRIDDHRRVATRYRRARDARVIAGTVNGSGSLRVEVTGTGEKTALAGIMRLVAQAQTSRSRAQALADRAAFALTIVAVGAAALTLVGWFIAGATARVRRSSAS